LAKFAWIALGIAVVGAALWAFLPGAASMGTATLSWFACAAYEFAVAGRMLCSGDCNIRVDLLALWPALTVVTVVAAAKYALASARRDHIKS
jgi:hypothetical protein